MRGRERQPPGRGPLALGLAFDAHGSPHWIGDGALVDTAEDSRFREAFQSYPLLLTDDGQVPGPLQQPGRGVDLAHRDARLGICSLRDGRMLIALTRFDGLGGALGALPLGITTQEMAALMGALDCATAMLLDGGISAQLMLRDSTGSTMSWPGMRRVPLGLVFIPRS
jgi:exopolysaccharide biosynthesis protein